MCICCCMLNLITVFLFILEMMRSLVYPPDEAASHVAVVSTLWGVCVGVLSDTAVLAGGPVVQCWASSWTTGRWMSCEVLVSAQTTTYSLQRGSFRDCHWRYCAPFDANLCHLTADCYFTFSLSVFKISWRKQGSRFWWNTRTAFVELDYFGKDVFFFLWSGKSWIKDESRVLLSQCSAGSE